MSEAGHYHSIVERISMVKLAQFARPIDKEVLSALAWRGNFKTGANCCPSLATLAADVGIERRTAASSVQRLKADGWVKSRRRHRETTVYAVNADKLPTTRCASDQAITTKCDSDQAIPGVVIRRSPDPLSTDPLKERAALRAEEPRTTTPAPRPAFAAPRPQRAGHVAAGRYNCPHPARCRTVTACTELMLTEARQERDQCANRTPPPEPVAAAPAARTYPKAPPAPPSPSLPSPGRCYVAFSARQDKELLLRLYQQSWPVAR